MSWMAHNELWNGCLTYQTGLNHRIQQTWHQLASFNFFHQPASGNVLNLGQVTNHFRHLRRILGGTLPQLTSASPELFGTSQASPHDPMPGELRIG